MMDNLLTQINDYYSGEMLIDKLTVLPEYNYKATSLPERMISLLDLYKIFIPNNVTVDIYNRLYLALINSLDKKNTLIETELTNNNFRTIKGYKRYGVIGGIESFKITGTAGVGKTSNIHRCADIITGNVILKSDDPYKEIIPILFVECVADGSFKSLLYSILQEVDARLGTTYFTANKHVTTTVDVLLAAVSNVLINHVALLVIDEIERVANDSKRGDTLINYLTQLVNQSNVAICFVGNEYANKYFETKEYMSRRTIGISIKKMEYDENFYRFVSVLLRYQYTKKKIELTPEIARTIYKLTNGAPSMIISLFVETQKMVILNGSERLDIKAFETCFRDNFANMIPYLALPKEETVQKKKTTPKPIIQDSITIREDIFMSISKAADKDISTAISMLKDIINVEFIKV